MWQDRLNNTDDEATGGKGGAVRSHSILQGTELASYPSTPFLLPPPCLSTRRWAGHSKVFIVLLAPQRGDAGLSLKPGARCTLLEAAEGTRGSLESGIKATTGSHRST